MVKPRESPHHGHRPRGKSTLMVLLALIPHSRGIYLFLLLLFEVAETVDGGEGIVVVGHPDTHGIVLIAYCGARVDVVVQDVFAFCHKTPLAVGCAIAERGIEAEQSHPGWPSALSFAGICPSRSSRAKTSLTTSLLSCES